MGRDEPGSLVAVVFDLDGTLVDSLAVSYAAFNAGFTHGGGPRLSNAQIRAQFGPGEKEIFERRLGHGQMPAAYRAYVEHLRLHVHEIRPHDGIVPTLQALRERGIRLGIFTGRGWETTRVILQYLEIESLFGAILTSDHARAPKPHPDGLAQALRELRIDPREAAYVGDSHQDLEVAKRLGARSVAALWDPHIERESLLAGRPDVIAETPSDILNLRLDLAPATPRATRTDRTPPPGNAGDGGTARRPARRR